MAARGSQVLQFVPSEVFGSATPPENPAVGQLWRNTCVAPNELVAWTGKGLSNARSYSALKSGASVLFEDLSDDRSLLVTVKTVAAQAGSGAPSPANIRPISGKTPMKVTLNGREYALTPSAPLYGLEGAEDEIGSDGHEAHRTALISFVGTEAIEDVGLLTGIMGKFRFCLPDGAYPPPKAPESNGEVASVVSSHFPSRNSNETFSGYVGVSADVSARLNMTVELSVIGAVDGDSSATKIQKVKTWLAAQYAAGTPVTVLYQRDSNLTASVAPNQIIGTDGLNTVAGDGASITVQYTGSGWAALGAVNRMAIEAVSISPEEGLRVDTVLSSADGAHHVPTFFNARGAKYGLFRSSDGMMILGGMVLPNGRSAGVAGALVSPGAAGETRVEIETATEGSGQARVDTAALNLVQPSFSGATGANPAPTGEKMPVRIEAVRSAFLNAQSEYVDNFSVALKALGGMRLVALNEDGGELAWLQVQRGPEGSTIYTDGAYSASDKARTLANFAPTIHMSMPTGESIVYNATSRRYMLDWKEIRDDFGRYGTFKGGNQSLRSVGIVMKASGFYRFVFHADLEQASSSSGAMLYVNKMPSDWTPPTARDYVTDAELTPTRIAYRRAASAPLNASVTTCDLVADLWCYGGEKILPVVSTAAASKMLIPAGTFFTAQKIG